MGQSHPISWYYELGGLPFYGHYTGQPALAGTSSKELEDFVVAKFYCLHALADDNQCIQIREKTLEFS